MILQDEEEDFMEENASFPSPEFLIRLFAIFIATFAGSLVTPEGSDSVWSLAILLVGIPGGAVVSGVVNNKFDQPSFRERELDDWDDKYRSTKESKDD